jgi:hypothetical protein
LAHAVCGRVGAPQALLAHVVSAVGVVFHCERREWVFARDFLRLGTATVLLLRLGTAVYGFGRRTSYAVQLLLGAAKLLLQRRPARVDLLVAVVLR